MSTQKIDSSKPSQVVGAILLGGGVQSDTSLDIQGIQFGSDKQPGGIYAGYMGNNTGTRIISGNLNAFAATGIQLTINDNTGRAINDRPINYVESVSGINYSTTIMGLDGVLYGTDGSAGGLPTVTNDQFGNDNAAREGWNAKALNIQTRSGVPATGYYDLQ